MKLGRNVVKKTTKSTEMRIKVRNKINTSIKNPHLKKGFPIKTIKIYTYRERHKHTLKKKTKNTVVVSLVIWHINHLRTLP